MRRQPCDGRQPLAPLAAHVESEAMSDPRDPIRFHPEDLEQPDMEVEGLEPGDTERALTREELAWELVELLEELSIDEMNELVSKNVPLESIEFFSGYATEFSKGLPIDDATVKRLPNLMLLGYLLRVLEDRLVVDPSTLDA